MVKIMGDMGDYFRDMDAHSKKKRASNREQSAQYLADKGIVFTSHNQGAHLIVEGNNGHIDFWPGTGKWKTRDGRSGFGVRKLVEFIK